MVLEVLRQLNWVDIFCLILLLRMFYISGKSGFAPELFKFFGTVLAIYLSLHYYVIFSDYLGERLGVNNIPLEHMAALISVLLALLGYLFFALLRRLFNRFLTMEAVAGLNKWGGILLGLLRGVCLASLVLFIMAASGVDYLRQSAARAYCGKYIIRVAPDIYSGLWSGVVSKFRTQEKFNKAILDISGGLETNQ